MATYLNGIKVLDASRLLPGPFCSKMLGDLGAQVTRLSCSKFPDPTEDFPALFETLNNDKDVLDLNLKDVNDLEYFYDHILPEYDVFLDSFLLKTAEKLKITPDIIQSKNPGIIHCSITGYGRTGKGKNTPGHDLNYIAKAGVLGHIINPREKDSNPRPSIPNFQIADVAAGSLFSVNHITSALVKKLRTGVGSYIDMSMYHNIRYLTQPALPSGMFQGLLPWYNVYRTSDSMYMALGCFEKKFWDNFCDLLNLAHLKEKHTFQIEKVDVEIFNVISDIISTKTQNEWSEIADQFASEKRFCCFAPVVATHSPITQSGVQKTFF